MSVISVLFKKLGYVPEGVAAKTIPVYDRIPVINGMTLEKWRKETSNIAAARDLWKHPVFQDILSIARNAQPRGYPPRGVPINSTMAAVELGRCQGYLDCLGIIEATVDIPPEPTPDIPSDFGAEEAMKDYPTEEPAE
jgi:hypothetical protein